MSVDPFESGREERAQARRDARLRRAASTPLLAAVPDETGAERRSKRRRIKREQDNLTRLQVVSMLDSDREAKARALSRESGTPGVVSQDQQVQDAQRQRAREEKLRKFVRDPANQKVLDWMVASQENATVSNDQTDGLSNLARVANDYGWDINKEVFDFIEATAERRERLESSNVGPESKALFGLATAATALALDFPAANRARAEEALGDGFRFVIDRNGTPVRIAVAGDEMPTDTAIAREMRHYIAPEGATMASFGRMMRTNLNIGFDEEFLNGSNMDEVYANLSIGPALTAAELEQRAMAESKVERLSRTIENWQGTSLGDVGEIPKQAAQFIGSAKYALKYGGITAATMYVLRQGIKRVPKLGRLVKPIDWLAEKGITRYAGVTGMFLHSMRQEGGAMYRESLERVPPSKDFPANHPYRNLLVLTGGAAAAFLETYGQLGLAKGATNSFKYNRKINEMLGKMMAEGAAKPALMQWAISAHNEGITEGGQEFIAAVVAELGTIMANEATPDEALDAFFQNETFERIMHSIRVGRIVGGGFGGASAGFGSIISQVGSEGGRAPRAPELLKTIKEEVLPNLEQLKQRGGTYLRDSLDAAAEGGVDTVSVSAPMFQLEVEEGRIDEDAFFENLPEDVRVAYEEAKENGGDFDIGLGDYVTQILETDLHEKVVNHIRIDQDDFTEHEQTEHVKTLKERIEKVAERAKAGVEALTEREAKIEFIAKSLADDFLAASPTVLDAQGKTVPLTRREARLSAQLNASMIVNMAERFGVEPVELAEKVGALNVVGFHGVPGVAGQLQDSSGNQERRAQLEAEDERLTAEIAEIDKTGQGLSPAADAKVEERNSILRDLDALPKETGLDPTDATVLFQPLDTEPSVEQKEAESTIEVEDGEPVSPFKPPPAKDVEGRLRRKAKRAEQGKKAKGRPRQKKWKRKRLKLNNGTVMTIGEVRPQDWVERVTSVLTPKEIAQAREWYREIAPKFEGRFSDQFEPWVAAWLIAQQKKNTTAAMLDAVRVREQVISGITGLKGGLADARLRAFWTAVRDGGIAGLAEIVPGAQKLYDFVDAALGKTTRTWMGNDPAGGQPAVIDVHTARDVGFVDKTLHADLKRLGVPQSVLDDIVIDMKLAPSETQYEYGSEFLNGLREYANETGALGGDFALAAELQAIGWVAIIKQLSKSVGNVETALAGSTRTISTALNFGKGAPYNETFAEFLALDYAGQEVVADGVVQAVLPQVTKLLGDPPILRVITQSGGWLDEAAEPSTQIELVASPKVTLDVAAALGYLLQQTGMRTERSLAVTPLRGKIPDSANEWFIDLIDKGGAHLADSSIQVKLWAKIREFVPELSGYHPVEDGDLPGVRFGLAFADEDGKDQYAGKRGKKRVEKELVPGILKAVAALEAETGESIEIDVIIQPGESGFVGNDWKENPDGASYLQGLETRYGPDVQKELRDLRSGVEANLRKLLNTRQAEDSRARAEVNQDQGLVAPQFQFDDDALIAGIYFSRMALALEEKLPNKGKASDYAKTIAKWAKAGQLFKATELESLRFQTMGLIEWLEIKQGEKISKQQIVDFVKAKGVRVETQVLGATFVQSKRFDETNKEITRLRELSNAAQELASNALTNMPLAQITQIYSDAFPERRGRPAVAQASMAHRLLSFVQWDMSDLVDANTVELQRITIAALQEAVPLGDAGVAIDWANLGESAEELNALRAEGQQISKPTQFGNSGLILKGPVDLYQEVLIMLPDLGTVEHDTAGWTAAFEGDTRRWTVAAQDGATIGFAFQVDSEQEAIEQVAAKGDKFEEGHFIGYDNVVVHVRITFRTDVDGKKVLLIEEIQSDWHQSGRKQGYIGTLYTRVELDELIKGRNKHGGGLKWTDPKGSAFPSTSTLGLLKKGSLHTRTPIGDIPARPQDKLTAIPTDGGYLIKQYEDYGVPKAPFEKTGAWSMLGFKMALRMAVDAGVDKVAWTTGEQQNLRNNLGQEIELIDWNIVRLTAEDDVTLRVVTFQMIEGGELIVHLDENGLMDVQTASFEDALEGKYIWDAVGEKMGDEIMENDDGTIENEDFKTLGDDLRPFYDHSLVNTVNTYLKRFGQTVGEATLVSGRTTRDFESESPDATRDLFPMIVHSMDVTPEMGKSVEAGLELFQPDEDEGGPGAPKGPRGFFDPPNINDPNATVGLGENANLSTWLHETGGHYFTHVLAVLAADPNAPQQIKDDYDTLLRFVGLEPGQPLIDPAEMRLAMSKLRDAQASGDAAAIRLATEGVTHVNRHAETLARAMEQYLREGKAPSIELQDAFYNFSQWLKDIYSTIERLTGRDSLPDDVNEVFDRLIASDEEIERARNEHQLNPLLDERPPEGMTDEQWALYKKRAERAHSASRKRILQLKNKRDKKLRKAQDDEDREAMTDAVTIELRQSPIHQAREWLADGTWIGEGEGPGGDHAKLNRKSLVEEFGERILRELPARNNGVLAGKHAKETLDHWTVASLFGLSPAELIEGLKVTPRFDDAVEQRVNQELARESADQQTVEEQNLDALHEIEQAQLVIEEMRWLKRMLRLEGASKVVGAAATRQVADEGAGQAKDRAADVVAAQAELETAEIALVEARESTEPTAITQAEQVVNEALIAVQGAEERRRAATTLRRAETAAKRATAGLKVDMKGIRARAEADVARRRFRELRPASYSAAERRAVNRSLRAIAARDWGMALQAKEDQLYSHFAFRAAKDAQGKAQKLQSKVRAIVRPKQLKKIEAGGKQYLDHILAMAIKSGLIKTTRQPPRPNDDLVTFIKSLSDEDGINVSFDAGLVQDILADQENDWRDMTLLELEEVGRAIRNLDHLAVEANKIRISGIKMTRDEFVAKVVANATEKLKLDDHRHDRENKDHSHTGFAKFKDTMVSAHSWLIKIESFAVYLDGGVEGGPAWEFFGQGAREAQFVEHKLKEDFGVDMHNIFAIYDGVEQRSMSVKKTYIPEVDRSFTREELIMIGLNMGNEHNREALKEGWAQVKGQSAWTEEQLQAVLAVLERDDKNIRVIEAIWVMLEARWPMIKEHELLMSGIAPQQVIIDQYTLPSGRVLAGGYFPLAADPVRSERARKFDEKLQVSQMFGGSHTGVQTRNGFINARRDFGGKAINLKFDVLYQHINDVAHDTAQRKFVVDAVKIIEHPDFEALIRDVTGSDEAGSAYLQSMKAWVSNIAGDSINPLDPASRILKASRIGANIAVIGFSLTTVMVQVLALSNGAAKVGFRNMVRAMGSWLSDPHMMNDYVDAHSKEIPHRMRTRDREVAALASQLKREARLDKAREWGYFMVGTIDVWTAKMVWLGANIQAMNDNVLDTAIQVDEVRANNYADRVVIQTQGGGAPKDLARIQSTNSELAKQFTVFYTFWSAQWDLNENLIRNTFQFKTMGKTDFINKMVWMMIVAPLVSDLILGRYPDDDEDEGEWVKWGVWTVLRQFTSTLPVVSQVTAFAERQFGGFSMGPSEQVLTEAGEGLRAFIEIGLFAADEDKDAEDVRDAAIEFVAHTATAAAMFKGVPGPNQARRLARTVEAFLNEEEVPLRLPLFGARK